MTDAIQAVLPIQLIHAIGNLIGANNSRRHDTSRGPLGKVCVRRVDDDTVQVCGTDGHALMSCEVACVHNLPEGQTFTVNDVPRKVPTLAQCQEPFLPELEPWTAAVDPTVLEKVMARFEGDSRAGAFSPDLAERCLRALRYCGFGCAQMACHRDVTRFSTTNRWGPTPLVVLLAGVRTPAHRKEEEEALAKA